MNAIIQISLAITLVLFSQTALSQKITDKYHGTQIDSLIIGDERKAYFRGGNDDSLAAYLYTKISKSNYKLFLCFNAEDDDNIIFEAYIDSLGNTYKTQSVFNCKKNKNICKELSKIISSIKWEPALITLKDRKYHDKSSKLIKVKIIIDNKRKTFKLVVSTNFANS